jgi:hypothetical protein
MINWNDRPPADTIGVALPLIRASNGRPFRGHVTCHHLLGCNTHYWSGRTTPCASDDCPACKEGAPWRWKGYLSAIDCDTRRHVLLEVTALAAEPLVQYQDAKGTLRGALIEATRPGTRKNQRVWIRIKPAPEDAPALPPEPNLAKALAQIWSLPTTELSRADNQWGTPAITHTPRQQPPYATTVPLPPTAHDLTQQLAHQTNRNGE